MLPDTRALVVFLVAAVSLNISPGPDMLYVISRSLGQGRRAGIVSALGIGVGTFFHIFVTAVGLSALLLSSPTAYEFIRYAGAAYLIFLGLRMLLGRRKQYGGDLVGARAETSMGSVFRQGITTNVLNPKVALFFLAFIPQFVDKSKGAVVLQIVLLGLIFDTSGTIWNVAVASLAGRASDALKKRSGFSRIQEWLPGSILVALGLFVIFT